MTLQSFCTCKYISMKLNSFAKILQHVKKSPRWVIIMTKHCQNLVTLSLKVPVSPTRCQISAQSYRVYLAPVFQSRTMSLRFSTSHSSSTLSLKSTRRLTSKAASSSRACTEACARVWGGRARDSLHATR